MKKIVIALFSLSAVFIVSVTITGEAKNKVQKNQEVMETYLPGRCNESPHL
jgi:hypothetical protein